MRILISNPDSLGDFVLRQPMIAALTAEGHEVQLVVRDFVSPLTALLFPEIPLLHCPGDPYSPGFTLESRAGTELLARLRGFSPDLLVAAPHQYTRLEEELALAIPETPTLALSGPLYAGDPGEGHAPQPQISFRDRVVVAADAPELLKNEQLASRILGRHVVLPRPAIEVGNDIRKQTRTRLRSLGFERGMYWIACVGDTSYTQIRNWGAANWTAFFAAMLRQTDATVMFVGTPEESPAVERIRDALGPLAQRTVNCSSEPDGIEALLGLIDGAAGYIGKDTGPMHFAAALGKPVLAIFGGGTWPRFIPAAPVGVALTVTVPCSPCGWRCHVQDSWCVKTVPVEPALAAFDRILRGELTAFEVIEMEAPATLIHRMVHESSDRYVTVIRQYAQVVKELHRASPAGPSRDPAEQAGAAMGGATEPVSAPSEPPQVVAAALEASAAAAAELAELRGRTLELQAQIEEKSLEAATLARLLPVLRDEIDHLTLEPLPAPQSNPWHGLLRRLRRSN